MGQTHSDIVEGWHYLLAVHLSNLAAVGSWRKWLWDRGRDAASLITIDIAIEGRGMEECSRRGGGEREKTRVHFLIKAP